MLKKKDRIKNFLITFSIIIIFSLLDKIINYNVINFSIFPINLEFIIILIIINYSFFLSILFAIFVYLINFFYYNNFYHYFLNFSDLYSSIYFLIKTASIQTFLNYLGVLFFLFFLILIILKIYKLNQKKIYLKNLIIIFITLFFLDYFSSANYLNNVFKIKYNIGINFFSSPTFQVFKHYYHSHNLENKFLELKKNDVFNETFIENISQNKTNVLIINIESLGINYNIFNEYLNEYIHKNLDKKKYNITINELISKGHTIQDEFRTLCNLEINSIIEIEENFDFKNCVINRLKNKGFNTYSLHGYQKAFYKRNLLYEKMGFQNRKFLNDFRFKNRCGKVFIGICDDELINYIFKKIHEYKEPWIIYALTLNTHYPISRIDIPNNINEICKKNNFEYDLCLINSYYFNLFSLIINNLNNTDKKFHVIIKGDHPSINLKKFFKNDKVPLIRINSK